MVKREVENSDYSEQVFTGWGEDYIKPPGVVQNNIKTAGDAIESIRGTIKDNLLMDMSKSIVVDVYTIDYVIQQYVEVTNGSIINFQIDFDSGQIIKDSFRKRNLNSENILHNVPQVTNITKQSMIPIYKLNKSVRRENIINIQNLNGSKK